MKILVAGTGAVGSFYGAKLGQSGADVGFLCRSDYTLVLQKGVEIESVWGNFHYTPSVVVSSAAAYRDHSGAADIVLVALKSLPCIDVQAIIRDAVGPGTSVVLLQNGIGIEQSVAAAFPANEILSGIAFVCINRVGPGRIRHTDYGRVVIGRYQAGMSERLAAIAMMLERAGIPTRIAADIVMERWVKLVWNAPFNPLSVLCGGVTTRDILDSPECTLVARRVMEEIVAVAAAEGFVLPADIIDKNMADTARMEPYKTSMCLDYESGRPLEVDAILGRVVDIARRRCVPVPHIETTYAILSAVAARMTPCRQPGE
ncbi:MAG: 2-dehydropantoate 2-reductase [bacterium]